MPLSADTQDRRTQTRLREIFEEAYVLIAPFFDPANCWSGQTLDFLAFRIMRENYPDISREEVLAFINAAKRVHGERQVRS